MTLIKCDWALFFYHKYHTAIPVFLFIFHLLRLITFVSLLAETFYLEGLELSPDDLLCYNSSTAEQVCPIYLKRRKINGTSYKFQMMMEYLTRLILKKICRRQGSKNHFGVVKSCSGRRSLLL